MSKARPGRLHRAASWTVAGLAACVLMGCIGWGAGWLLTRGWSAPAVTAVALCSGLIGGVLGDRNAEVRRITVHRMEQRVDAWVRADTKTDLDLVGPVTPPPGTHRVPSDGEPADTRVGDDLDVEPWINPQGVWP